MSRFVGNTRLRDAEKGASTPPGAALAVLCVAQFVVVLDATIVTIALPAMQSDLRISTAGLQWVITAYTLAFGGLLILAGRVGDAYGHRRVFIRGLTVFAIGSLACALAWSPEALVLARTLQGTGAAMVAPTALSLLGALFPAGASRGRAVAWWTASAAGGGASGWVLGGVMVDLLGWRSVFWVNLPVAAGGVLAARRLLTETARHRAARLDLPGAIGITGALALLIYGMTGVQEHHPAAVTLLVLLAATALFAGFVLVERRSRNPLVPPASLRRPGLPSAVLVASMLTATTTPPMFFLVLYEQQVLDVGAFATGVRTSPFNLAVIAGAVVGPRLRAALGARACMGTGLLGIAVGAASLLRTGGSDTYLVSVLPGLVLLGVGLAVASVASTNAGTSAVDEGEHGVASGLLNAAAQIGTVLGLAAIATFASAHTGNPPTAASRLVGYHWGFAAAALTAAAAGLLALLTRRGPRAGAR